MSSNTTESTSRAKSGMYAKGAARRELLIDTAAKLLNQMPLNEISLKIVAKEAAVPVSSAYHFYNNSFELFSALAERFSEELANVITAPYSGGDIRSWQTLFDTTIDRAVQLYKEKPAYQHLIISGKAPPEIKLSDRNQDEDIGQLVIDNFSRYFIFPNPRQYKDIFFHATEIVDLMLSLSVIKYGEIQDNMVTEAKKASKAYLREYLPQEIPVK